MSIYSRQNAQTRTRTKATVNRQDEFHKQEILVIFNPGTGARHRNRMKYFLVAKR